MVEVNLPFPSKKLSPNARLHWAAVAKVKKQYRHECFWLTVEHYNAVRANPPVPEEGNLTLEVTFYRPTRRAYDRDNLLARMKSGLDGVADALHINDKRFDPVIIRVAEETGNYVNLKIYQQ